MRAAIWGTSSLTHFAVIDADGEWRTACGANTQRTTGRLEHVDCTRCRRTGVFKAENGEDFKLKPRSNTARGKDEGNAK